MSTKTALVTGGTRGIGLAIAKKLSKQGYKVIITGTTDNSFKDISKDDDLIHETVDFSNDDSLRSFLGRIVSHKIDILINNAGINKINYTHEVDHKNFDLIQKINVAAPFKVAHAIIPHMLENKWGRIVNITSIFGHITKEKRVSYTTSKFALQGMTKTMSTDYAKDNILVNSVAPGFIDTELTRTVLTQEQIDELCSQVPMNRLGKPEEIANVVNFLCSSENSFITGQNIIVDGGFTNV